MIPPRRVLRGGEPHNEWVYDERTEVYTRTWRKEYHDTWNGRPVVWRCTAAVGKKTVSDMFFRFRPVLGAWAAPVGRS